MLAASCSRRSQRSARSNQVTKIIFALALTASLLACGKKKPAAAPDNTSTETQSTTQSAGATGGTSYGGASYGTTAPTP